MKSHNLFKQYTWLVKILLRHKKLTLSEINNLWLDYDLSEGVPMARTTFNRHRDAILDIFGIIIDCDKKDGFRYYIYNDEVLRQDSIQNWMLSTLSVNSMLAESKAVYNRIALEHIPSEGENLHKFIRAMKHGVCLKIEYKKYGTGNVSSRLIEPYFVKLFNKRWYALARSPEPDAYFFILAFDRIVSLDTTNKKFAYNAEVTPSDWFKDCYGIVRDEDTPIEKVVVRAFGKETNYLRDLPLHHSQKEIAVYTNYSDFELTISPTPDFITPLLSRGVAIKVLHPQWLADEIKRQHQEAAKLYN